jgi:hypothetical protein
MTTNIRINAKNQVIVNEHTILDGTWSLTPEHELHYSLDASNSSTTGDKTILQATIKDIRHNALLFEATNQPDTQTFLLEGTWQADEENKLIFKIKKENGLYDTLTFNNTWIMDTRNRLVYEYETQGNTTTTHQLFFKGYWDTADDKRLYYELDQKSGSRLAFRIGASQLEKNRIVYKIMVGGQERSVDIRGEWRVSPTLKLGFEVDYGDGLFKTIKFEGEVSLTDKDTLSFKLGDGNEIKLSHEFLKDSDVYLQYRQSSGGPQLEGGIEVKW